MPTTEPVGGFIGGWDGTVINPVQAVAPYEAPAPSQPKPPAPTEPPPQGFFDSLIYHALDPLKAFTDLNVDLANQAVAGVQAVGATAYKGATAIGNAVVFGLEVTFWLTVGLLLIAVYIVWKGLKYVPDIAKTAAGAGVVHVG